jgi:hypothetical protein
MMLQLDKVYYDSNNHRIKTVHEQDDRLVGVNLFNGDLHWYRLNGKSVAGADILMPVRLEPNHLYKDRAGRIVRIVYIASDENDQMPCLGVFREDKKECASWYSITGHYHHDCSFASFDLIEEVL